MRNYRTYWIQRCSSNKDWMPHSGQYVKVVDYYRRNLLVSQKDFKSAGALLKW